MKSWKKQKRKLLEKKMDYQKRTEKKTRMKRSPLSARTYIYKCQKKWIFINVFYEWMDEIPDVIIVLTLGIKTNNSLKYGYCFQKRQPYNVYKHRTWLTQMRLIHPRIKEILIHLYTEFQASIVSSSVNTNKESKNSLFISIQISHYTWHFLFSLLFLTCNIFLHT